MYEILGAEGGREAWAAVPTVLRRETERLRRSAVPPSASMTTSRVGTRWIQESGAEGSPTIGITEDQLKQVLCISGTRGLLTLFCCEFFHVCS